MLALVGSVVHAFSVDETHPATWCTISDSRLKQVDPAVHAVLCRQRSVRTASLAVSLSLSLSIPPVPACLLSLCLCPPCLWEMLLLLEHPPVQDALGSCFRGTGSAACFSSGLAESSGLADLRSTGALSHTGKCRQQEGTLGIVLDAMCSSSA